VGLLEGYDILMLAWLDEVTENEELVVVKLWWLLCGVVICIWIIDELGAFFSVLGVFFQYCSPSSFNNRMIKFTTVLAGKTINLMLQVSTEFINLEHSTWFPIRKGAPYESITFTLVDLLLVFKFSEPIILVVNKLIKQFFKHRIFNLIFYSLIFDIIKYQRILPSVTHVAFI